MYIQTEINIIKDMHAAHQAQDKYNKYSLLYSAQLHPSQNPYLEYIP